MPNGNAAIRKLRRQRQALLARLTEFSTAIRGSIFERFSTCSRPQCACHQGARHGPRTYLTIQVQGRQRQFYVPKSQVSAARRVIKEYHRLMQTVDRLSALNLKLVRLSALEESCDERGAK